MDRPLSCENHVVLLDENVYVINITDAMGRPFRHESHIDIVLLDESVYLINTTNANEQVVIEVKLPRILIQHTELINMEETIIHETFSG